MKEQQTFNRRHAPCLAILGVLLGLTNSGCITVGASFTNSSIDHNDGKQQQIVLPGDIEAVGSAALAIMNKRGGVLLRRVGLRPGHFVLWFRVDSKKVSSASVRPDWWGGLSITEKTVSWGSKYYVELIADKNKTAVMALGVPIILGRTACPALAQQRYVSCSAAEATSTMSFAATAQDETGVRVDGRREFDTVEGLFGELQSKRWTDTYGTEGTTLNPSK